MKKIKIMVVLGVLALTMGSQVFGQLAEAPFYTEKKNSPNVMLLLDNSGSMINDNNKINGVTRLQILKNVLTGAGSRPYKTVDGDQVYIAHGDTTTAGMYKVMDELTMSMVRGYRVRLSSGNYDANDAGSYFVFISPYDVNHYDADVFGAITDLNSYLQQQEGKSCLHLKTTADIADDATGSPNRDIWEASSTCAPAPNYMTFGQAFRLYFHYEETGALNQDPSSVEVVPVDLHTGNLTASWTNPNTGHTLTGQCWPTTTGGTCDNLKWVSRSQCWTNRCFMPSSSSNYFVLYYAVQYTPIPPGAEEVENHRTTLGTWAAANGGAEAYCPTANEEVWGDRPYSQWTEYYSNVTLKYYPLSDGNTKLTRQIYTACSLSTPGANPIGVLSDDAIRAIMIGELPHVTPVDVVPEPDGSSGPEFIFDPSSSERIDEYLRDQIGLPPLDPADIDLDSLTFGDFFQHLYYDGVFFEDQGIMDLYPDVNYGLMVYDNTTGCTYDDFPVDSVGNCVGANLVWNLDGWAQFPAYSSTYSRNQLNTQLQAIISGTGIDPPNTSALTPIAASLHDAYRYFYNTDWTGSGSTRRPYDANGYSMFFDLGFPTANGSATDHIVQDDPYFHPTAAGVDPCRRNFLVFLTDGSQTQGEGCNPPTSTTCPVDTVIPKQREWIAALKGTGQYPAVSGVKTYLIGFGNGLAGDGYAELAAMADEAYIDTLSGDTHQFFKADSPEELFASFAWIFNAIMQGNYARTAPNVSTFDQAGITSYFAIDPTYPLWRGHLQGWELPLQGDTSGAPLVSFWPTNDAAEMLNDNLDRHLFFAVSATNPMDAGDITEFTDAAVATLDPYMNPSNTFGTSTEEYTIALVRNDSGATFITGAAVDWALGPNFHSQPQLVGPPRSVEYSLMPGYKQFAQDHADRPKLIFMGTGYGILHAFDFLTGREAFGYIPQGVLKSLPLLYQGKQIYGVDGTPVVDDVYGDFDDNSGTPDEWRSVLIVGLGGGGTTYSALDVTDATTAGYGGVVPLWNFRHPKLGQAWSAPVSDFINLNGERKNVAFFGGGLRPGDTPNVGGSFFIVDTVTGATIKTFDLYDYRQIADIPSLTLNGGTYQNWNEVPGPVNIIDRDKDGYFDWAYVGDNEGRVWKINFHDPDPDNWTQCLFYDVTDTNLDEIPDNPTRREPIWYNPVLVNGPNEMLIVYFSTGHIEVGDVAEDIDRTYRLYAVHDAQDVSTAGCQYASTLAESLIGSDNPWPQAFEPGERLVAPPFVTQSLLIFQTYVPNSGVACSEGQMRLWIVDYLNGNTVWDFGGDTGAAKYTTMSNTGTLTIDANGDMWTTSLKGGEEGSIEGQGGLGTPPPYPMSWAEGVELPF